MIENFYKQNWFTDKDSSSILVRFYSSLFLDEKLLSKFLTKNLQNHFLDQYGVLINCGLIKDLSYHLHKILHISENDLSCQQTILEAKNLKLPTSNYLIVSTPLCIDGQASSKETAIKNLNNVAGLLRVVAGNNFVKSLAYEFMVELKTGNMKAFSETLILPLKKFQGPFLHEESAKMCVELCSATSSDIKNKNSITLALDFFERASQEYPHKKFIYYWMAIDILKGGHRIDLYNPFREIYKNESKKNEKYVIEDLGLKIIRNIRNGYFHDGQEYSVNEEQERYIHMLFLDLLRHKMKLPSEKYLSNFIDAGFDPNSFKRNQLNIAQVILS